MTTENSNVQDISPIEVERYLKGIEYPADKQNLLDCAKNNSAPENVLQLIGKLSDISYQSPVDVAKEIGKLH